MSSQAELKPIMRSGLPPLVARKARRVLRNFQYLLKFQTASVQEQQELLCRQLQSLLHQAKRYSEYWSGVLEGLSFAKDPAGVLSLLQEIPPLTREVLQSRFEELKANFPNKEKFTANEVSTSGSTGTPITVEHVEAIFRPAQYAADLLEVGWHKIDPRKRFGIISASARDSHSYSLGEPFIWYWPVSRNGFSLNVKDVDGSDRPYSDIYDYCASKRPAYLVCGPNMISGLSQYAIEKKRAEFRPDGILSFGGAILRETRELALGGLHAKIFEKYSSEETGIIAKQCPKHDHLHVLSPISLVEIVDDDGNACGVGQPGRILVTAMQSIGMPILRYEIGDIGEWDDACDCGITLPTIKRILGRTRHRITNPDGKKVMIRLFARDFKDLAGLQEYRFVLHRNDLVVAQIRAEKKSQQLSHKIADRIQKILGYPYPVDVRFVESIDWGTSLKKETFCVSDDPAPSDIISV